MTRGTPAASPGAQEVLELLARMLIDSGESAQALSSTFARICLGNRRDRRRAPAPSVAVIKAPHLISHWYTHRDYLDKTGEPRPLPLTGPHPSIESLIARVCPGAEPEEIAHELARLGSLMEQGGRFRPTGRYVSLNEDRHARLSFALMAMRGILRSLLHNVGRRPQERLLVRSAINPCFPTRALPAFRARLTEQVMELLCAVDAEMRREELQAGDEPTQQAGIVVFAIEDQSPARSGPNP